RRIRQTARVRRAGPRNTDRGNRERGLLPGPAPVRTRKARFPMRLYRYKHCAHPAFFDMPGPAATTRPDELREYFHGVLLHFRQESGHYYWQVLVADDPVRLAACRDHFGDERRDYAQALRDHYHKARPHDSQSDNVNPYATA